MKVKIGPYLKYWGPYQIVDKIFFWCKDLKYELEEKDLAKRWDYKAKEKMGDWLAETWLNDFLNKVYEKRKRKISIKIDKYDHWNAHNTASLVLLPLFEQLKEHKQGSGLIDDNDVPEQLRSYNGIKENEWDSDSLLHKRYEWVLNEVLFALKSDNDDWEDQFDTQNKEQMMLRSEYQKRVSNGFRLMGKYWQTFWD